MNDINGIELKNESTSFCMVLSSVLNTYASHFCVTVRSKYPSRHWSPPMAVLRFAPYRKQLSRLELVVGIALVSQGWSYWIVPSDTSHSDTKHLCERRKVETFKLKKELHLPPGRWRHTCTTAKSTKTRVCVFVSTQNRCFQSHTSEWWKRGIYCCNNLYRSPSKHNSNETKSVVRRLTRCISSYRVTKLNLFLWRSIEHVDAIFRCVPVVQCVRCEYETDDVHGHHCIWNAEQCVRDHLIHSEFTDFGE